MPTEAGQWQEDAVRQAKSKLVGPKLKNMLDRIDQFVADEPGYESNVGRWQDPIEFVDQEIDGLDERKDKIHGGLADKKDPSDFDSVQLKTGIKVEREHTDDPKIAEEIAMDHLTEDPDYYKKLKKIEKEGRVPTMFEVFLHEAPLAPRKWYGKPIKGDKFGTGPGPASGDPIKAGSPVEHFTSASGEYFMHKAAGTDYEAHFISKEGKFEELPDTSSRKDMVDQILAHHDQKVAKV